MSNSGYVERDQIRLMAWFDDTEASIAGPAIDNLPWVVQALRAVARQWPQQETQVLPDGPAPDHDDEVLDCTSKDLAVLILDKPNIISKYGEVFPGSGLATFPVEIAGRRRQDTEWAKAMVEGLALSIEQSTCPACSGPMNPEKVMNALSRRDNKTYICSGCGLKEGLQDFLGQLGDCDDE